MNEVPPALSAAFQERATLPPADICRLLAMDAKTLRQHVRAGNIRYVLKGFGEKRPRREFTLSDVLGFLDKRAREECPSTSRSTRRSTSMTSGAEVVAFTARHSRRNAAPPRR